MASIFRDHEVANHIKSDDYAKGRISYILKENAGVRVSGSRERLYNLPTDTALIGTYSHASRPFAVRDVAKCAISFTCRWGEDITDNKPACYSLVLECWCIGEAMWPREM